MKQFLIKTYQLSLVTNIDQKSIHGVLTLFDYSEDWVEVYDGRNISYPRIGNQLRGSALPPAIISTNNEIFLRFFSNNNDNSFGFKLQAVETGKE